jgi:TonB family protein
VHSSVPEGNAFLSPRLPHTQTEAGSEPPDAKAIIETLRQAIAEGKCEKDVILGAIAEAAQALSGASAAAVAMQTDGAVVCCGRSGESAPELGARLNVDSGISGECLRTGKVLRCDDTNKDYRADPIVCLRLGLRSIAAVPLHHKESVIGLLEAFSDHTYAFSEEHMDAMRRLAKLAEATYAQEISVDLENKPTWTKSRIADVGAFLSRAGASVRETSGVIITRLWSGLAGERKYYSLAGLAVVVLLVAVVGWRLWPKPASPPTAQAATSEAAAPAAVPGSTAAALVFKPTPSVESRDPKKNEAKGGVQRAALAATPDVVIHNLSSRAAIAEAPKTGSPQGESSPPPPSELAPEAPNIAAVNPDKAPLGTLFSAPPVLPEFGSPVSHGVSEGVLIHKVQPVYPTQGLPMRLEGAVVLQAVIAEDGKVKDLKVISGHPTLAQAAMDAVRQWRYRPYQLNGKPVAMQTQITINFKLP